MSVLAANTVCPFCGDALSRVIVVRRSYDTQTGVIAIERRRICLSHGHQYRTIGTEQVIGKVGAANSSIYAHRAR